MKVTIKDLLDKEIDVDVFNDVTDDICPAFAGKIYLTEDGEKYFSNIMSEECDVDEDNHRCVVLINGREDWETVWRNVSNLFSCIAGYCNYDRWNELFYE